VNNEKQVKISKQENNGISSWAVENIHKYDYNNIRKEHKPRRSVSPESSSKTLTNLDIDYKNHNLNNGLLSPEVRTLDIRSRESVFFEDL